MLAPHYTTAYYVRLLVIMYYKHLSLHYHQSKLKYLPLCYSVLNPKQISSRLRT